MSEPKRVNCVYIGPYILVHRTQFRKEFQGVVCPCCTIKVFHDASRPMCSHCGMFTIPATMQWSLAPNVETVIGLHSSLVHLDIDHPGVLVFGLKCSFAFCHPDDVELPLVNFVDAENPLSLLDEDTEQSIKQAFEKIQEVYGKDVCDLRRGVIPFHNPEKKP